MGTTWERGRWRRPCLSPAPARFSHFLLLNDFPPPSRSLEQANSKVMSISTGCQVKEVSIFQVNGNLIKYTVLSTFMWTLFLTLIRPSLIDNCLDFKNVSQLLRSVEFSLLGYGYWRLVIFPPGLCTFKKSYLRVMKSFFFISMWNGKAIQEH